MHQILHDTSGMNALRQRHLAIIQREVADITVSRIRMLNGNDHFVYIIDNATMFRFPQTSRPIDPHRKLALDDLAATGAVPFALPCFEIHIDDITGLWYERSHFLPGVALTPTLAACMDDDALMLIARQMGAFLTAVHTMSIDRAREIGMEEMDPTDFWAYMEQNPAA